MSRRRPPSATVLATLLAGLLGIVLLAACNDDGSATGAGDRSTWTSDGPPVGPRSYVAIGDSYTSAPRVGRSTSVAGCLQTARNYPHLLAERLDLELTDASCGGARTANLTRPQFVASGKNKPQLRALRPTTSLVTLSLGANDNNFLTGALSCIRYAAADPTGSPCQEHFGTRAERSTLLRTSERLLTDNVARAVRQVRERAPDARILVVGYPQFAPTASGCEQFPVADGDVGFVHGLNLLLNRSLAAAAEREDAEYVDVYAATRGHHMCAAHPWIAGGRPIEPAAPYHPYAAEQRAVADLLAQVLDD